MRLSRTSPLRRTFLPFFCVLVGVTACDDEGGGGASTNGPGVNTPPGTVAPNPATPPACAPGAAECAGPLASGALDPSFGGSGKVTDPASPAKKLALQADGKLLVVGGLTLSRFAPDGSVDASFGTAGHVTIVAKGGPLDSMQSLAVQSDGKIVVTGYTAGPTELFDDIAVFRFNADGTPDGSFGSGGHVYTDFAGSTDRGYAVLVQPDGAIVVGGIATTGSGSAADQDFALVRYLTGGTLDEGFGSGGKATVNIAGKADFGYAIALQGSRIVVAGRVGPDGGSDPDFGVVRFTSGGTIDGTFGTNGVVQIDYANGPWNEAAAVAVQSDGKIVVGGFLSQAGVYRYAVTRLTEGGARDDSFGGNGLVSTEFTGKDDRARGLALQSDDKIVLVGQFGSLGQPDFGVARYSTNGELDSTFGTDGHVAIDFFGLIDGANDVVIDTAGRIIVGGSAKKDAGAILALARVGK